MTSCVCAVADRPSPSQKVGTSCQVGLGTQPDVTPPQDCQLSCQLPAESTVADTPKGAAGPSTLVRTSSGADAVPRPLRNAVTTMRYAVSGKRPTRFAPSWPWTRAVPGARGAPESSAVALMVYVDGTQSWVS